MLRTLTAIATLMLLVVSIAGCSPLGMLNSLTPGSTYTAATGLEYGADPRQKLDVYQPRRRADARLPRDGYPVVVFFYGGTWVSGERSDYKFIGEALAAQGIVTVIADYRLYPQVRYPDFLTDCARALAWVQRKVAQYGGNARRLYVMGHSSGAYNAAMLALDPRWLAAVGLSPSTLAGWIGLAGPYDFLPMTNIEAQPVFYHPDYPAGSQPIDHVTKAAPVTFLGVPANDKLVEPERNTKQLAAKLRAAGVPVTLKLYARANHYTLIAAFARPLRGLAPVLNDVAGFVHGNNVAQ